MAYDIRIKRIHEPVDNADGARVLIDSLWPRGRRREEQALTDWYTKASPSHALRHAWAIGEIDRDAFEEAYLAEIEETPFCLLPLMNLAREGTLTLLSDVRDPEQSHLSILRQAILTALHDEDLDAEEELKEEQAVARVVMLNVSEDARVPATVSVTCKGPVMIVTIERPECRNAVDGPTAAALAEAFRRFDTDPALSVAILAGAGEHFCAGADLRAIASGDPQRSSTLSVDGEGPMGPSRLSLSKPVIAAISGYCVAGGLELAAWCDLRVADETAVLGVFCRRFGVPLIDGGTVRLPRLIGMSRAMDLILTGREVLAEEALQMGLINRLVPSGEALEAAEVLALQLAGLPQVCLRNDRQSLLEQAGMNEEDALQNEFRLGVATLESGEAVRGAQRFAAGDGRQGRPV